MISANLSVQSFQPQLRIDRAIFSQILPKIHHEVFGIDIDIGDGLLIAVPAHVRLRALVFVNRERLADDAVCFARRAALAAGLFLPS